MLAAPPLLDVLAAGYVAEAHVLAELGQTVEFIRGDEARHRQMMAARLQVLTEGEHVHVMGAQIAHDLFNFAYFFAQTQHQSGLGGEVCAQVSCSGQS